jgi:hypothetical protein
MRRLRIKFRAYQLEAGVGTFAASGQAAELTRGGVPVVVTIPTISGSTIVGQTLTSSTGSWTNSPTSYARQWLRSGVAISGATGVNHTLVTADAGTILSVRVTAANAIGSGVASESAGTAVITVGGAGAPALSTLPTLTLYAGASVTTVGSTLRVNPGRWTTDYLDTRQYPHLRYLQWKRNGAAISGAVGLTYVTGGADIGQQITCTESIQQIFLGSPYIDAGIPRFAASVQGTVYTATTAAVVPTGAVDPALVYPSNLIYRGSYRHPNPSGVNGLNYGGSGLAWYPAGDGGNGSFFMYGEPGQGNRVGEFRPVPVSSLTGTLTQTNYNALPECTLLNGMIAADEGWRETALGGEGYSALGMVVHNGRLIQSAVTGYSNTNPLGSHASRPLNLATTGDVKWARVWDTSRGFSNARGFAGYMSPIPAAWQTALGGKVITGCSGISIVSNSTDGPGALAFDPDLITGIGTTIQGNALIGYQNGQLESSDVRNVWNSVWNFICTPRGVVIPNGTRSCLFFGRGSNGLYSYGPNYTRGNGDDSQYDNTSAFPVISRIYDPVLTSTGEHAYPYTYRIWAYDLNDMAAVKAGTLAPGAIRPYGVWNFTLPIDTGSAEIMGACYDPARKLISIAQQGSGRFGEFSFHVYEVSNAVAA